MELSTELVSNCTHHIMKKLWNNFQKENTATDIVLGMILVVEWMVIWMEIIHLLNL